MREFIDRRWGLLAAATGAAVGLAGLFLVAAGFHGYPDSHGQLLLPGSDRDRRHGRRQERRTVRGLVAVRHHGPTARVPEFRLDPATEGPPT
jgi:hypothetical protein